MTDRHSLSEPRICPTATEDELSWEVDVYRENVTDPIETLTINDTTLPPRVRKGKIVWRLPTEPGKLPNFGTDERRRIMDLFKERKKNRRKKKLHSRVSSTSSLISEDEEKDDPSMDLNKISLKSKDEKQKKSNNNKGIGIPPTTTVKDSPTKYLKKPVPDSGISCSESGSITTTSTELPKKDKLVPPPQTMSESKSYALERNEQDRVISSTIRPQNTNSEFDPRIRKPEECSNDLEPTQNGNHLPPKQQLTSPPAPQLPIHRFFVVPHQKHPSTNPTTAVAKSFISIYYESITKGLTPDLCSYYHSNAQKSISVGGAHSVVIGIDDISMQIASLSGCIFSVRGVVAQDAANGGAHILITGVCTPKGGLATAFAHSVGLARLFDNGQSYMGGSEIDGHKYVIQNDALSLLSGEMTLAVEQQQQQQQQRQQEHLGENNHQYGFNHNSRDQQVTYTEHSNSSTLRPPGLFG